MCSHILEARGYSNDASLYKDQSLALCEDCQFLPESGCMVVDCHPDMVQQKQEILYLQGVWSHRPFASCVHPLSVRSSSCLRLIIPSRVVTSSYP